jgi:small subunit ribosomal protein S16
MVSIRLMRMGDKKRPTYRVVVADSRRFRNGRFIENIGVYNPLPRNIELKLNMERVEYWIAKGAQPSDTVRSLIERVRKSATAATATTVS